MNNIKKLFIPPVFVLIDFILIVLFYFLIPGYNYISFPYNLIGIFVATFGFTVMGKSYELYKKYETTLDIEESSFLITEGVFSKTRNPMYIGMFLLLLGLAICFQNLISIFSAFGFIFLMRLIFVPKEEKLMIKKFGQQYIEYKEKVRRWI